MAPVSRRARLATGALIAALAAPLALAQKDYPTRPVRLIVPLAPGGGQDTVARILGGRLSEILGQQILVDNRPGGGSVIASELVANAPPDGHTIYLASTTFVAAPSLHRRLPFDPHKDFAPVTRVSTAPGALVIHPSLPAKSVKELVALARARPGELTFGSAGIGAQSHFSGELFKMMAGIDIVHVPYRGSGPATTAQLAGEIAISFVNPIPTMPHVKAGKLRMLAVTTAGRWPLLAELPTIAESGVPGFQNIIWSGVVVPAATPKAIISQLQRGVAQAAQSPEVKKHLERQGTLPFGPDTPDKFAAFLEAEIAKWKKVARQAGIKPD